MSNRTKKANNAVLNAWKKEKELVLQGKGTRDWTEKQQKDIIEFGKAYDEDGKAFEGHHMMSVEKYPQFQEESKNIQFLTRKEHEAAHNGNFQNSTSGYYDYEHKTTIRFSKNIYIPCKTITLSKSIVFTNTEDEDALIKKEETKKVSINNELSFKKQPNEIEKIGNSLLNFPKKHPYLFGVIKILYDVGKNTLLTKVDSIINSDFRNDNEKKDMSNNESKNDNSENNNYTPNDVPAGGQHYHYKDGSIKWKEKDAYHRGDN